MKDKIEICPWIGIDANVTLHSIHGHEEKMKESDYCSVYSNSKGVTCIVYTTGREDCPIEVLKVKESKEEVEALFKKARIMKRKAIEEYTVTKKVQS